MDISHSSLPPDVLDAVTAASAVWADLSAQGLSVSFDTNDVTGRIQAQITDHEGTVHSTLKPSEVLALVEGNAPEQTRKSLDVHQQRQLDR